MNATALSSPSLALDPSPQQQLRTAGQARHQQRLAGKVAVVIGIGSGIGRGIALMFARQGAHVGGADLDAHAAAATVATAEHEQLSLHSVHPLDLTQQSSVERLVATAVAHCAGKGGVLAMTRQLAMEGGPHRIRANTISPGFIVTGATRRHLETVRALVDQVLVKKMIKRVGQPEDIAWAATFLCSDEAGWVTASDFGVDGGARAR